MLLTQLGLAMLGVIMSMATHTNSKAYLISSIICTVIYVYILYLMVYELGEKDKPAIDAGRAKLKPLKGFWISFCANLPNIICGVMTVVFFFFLAFQQPVEVYNEAGNKIDVYIMSQSGTTEIYDKVWLFSDNGARAFTYESDSTHESQIKTSDGKTTLVYEKNKDGYNEIILYTDTAESVSVSVNGEANAISGHWASNLYGVPHTIAIFFQMVFFGIKSELFGNSHYVYLATPFVPIIFCTIGYYFGATGKRIFFFLPERKQKPSKYR
ncbi:MAG: hypothetical protein IKU52_07620 [Clostridia bacterium]|nr:hypothetical protein [Clostridia bacterium]